MAQEQEAPQTTETPPQPQDGPVSDDAILSELASLGEDGDPDPAPQPEPQQETPADEQGQGEGEEQAKEEPEGELSEPDKAAESEAEPEQDAETAKRIEAIQRQEKRAKEAIAEERRQLDEHYEKVKPTLQAAERIEDLKRKADPVGILRELGYGEDDMESIARAAYYASPKAKQDPAAREAAERELRQRHQGSELEELRSEVKRMREEQQQRETQAQQQRTVQEYLQRVESGVGEATPLIQTWMKNDADGARQEMRSVAERLAREYGEVPDPLDVAKELEKDRRSYLQKLGVDPSLIGRKAEEPTATNTKTQTQTAGETKTAKTLSTDMGAPTEPRSEPATDEELDAEILRELQRGNLE